MKNCTKHSEHRHMLNKSAPPSGSAVIANMMPAMADNDTEPSSVTQLHIRDSSVLKKTLTLPIQPHDPMRPLLCAHAAELYSIKIPQLWAEFCAIGFILPNSDPLCRYPYHTSSTGKSLGLALTDPWPGRLPFIVAPEYVFKRFAEASA